jgi:hypothetical protein
MTTLADIVISAATFATDTTDVKGGSWNGYSGNGTYPKVVSGYFNIGVINASANKALSSPNISLYSSWQITLDVILGSLGSSSIGQYAIFFTGNLTINWRADNVANRLGIAINGTTIMYMSISAYTAVNTVALEYSDSFYYLYLNGALVMRVFSNGVGCISGVDLNLCTPNAGISYNASLKYRNIRLIQGAAPIAEGLTDPGFTTTPTPRTLLDPSAISRYRTFSSAKRGGSLVRSPVSPHPRKMDAVRRSGLFRALAAHSIKTRGVIFGGRIKRLPAPAGRRNAIAIGGAIVPNLGYLALGKLSGTTKAGANAVSDPVVLLDRATMRVLASTVSDANGNFVFNRIPLGISYMIIAKDTTGVYNAVVADNLTAVPY